MDLFLLQRRADFFCCTGCGPSAEHRPRVFVACCACSCPSVPCLLLLRTASPPHEPSLPLPLPIIPSASPLCVCSAFSTRTSRPDASAEANVRAANAGNGDGDEAAADVGEGFSSLEKGKGSIDDDTTSASSSAAASSLPSHKDASEADVCDEIGGDGGGFAMGAEVQLIHLAWGMPVAPHPPLGISTSTGVVDDPTDFRPTRLRALVNPYGECQLSHIDD